MVYGSGVLAPNSFEGGLYVDWTRNPVEFGVNGTRLTDIVDNFLTANFQLNYGVSKRFTIAMDVPVGFLNDVKPILSSTSGTRTSLNLGDLQWSGIYQFTEIGNPDTRGWGLAVVPFVTAPTGDESSFFGNKSLTGGLRLAADNRFFDRNYFSYNMGFRLRKEERLYNLGVGQELFGSVGYQIILSLQRHWEAFVELYGSTTFEKFFSQEISSPLEIYGGVRKKWPEHHVMALLGVGRGMNNGYGAPDFRLFAGLTYFFGTTPPPTPKKTEPEEGNVKITVKYDDGSAASAQIVLKNLDGTVELQKQERVSALSATLPPQKYQFAALAEGYFPKKGRFLIRKNETTQINIILKRLVTGKLENIGKVLFDLDKDTIKEESHPVLNEVVSILNRYPEITRIRVEAHTDSLSSDEYNLRLSTRRAKSVMDYLIKGGIDTQRLTSIGYGESKPIAINTTLEGRAQNRRVEFVILDVLPEDVEVKEYAPDNLYNIEKPKESPTETQ